MNHFGCSFGVLLALGCAHVSNAPLSAEPAHGQVASAPRSTAAEVVSAVHTASEAAPAGPAPTATAAVAAPAAPPEPGAVSSQYELELVSTGAEPRRVLRYVFRPAEVYEVRLRRSVPGSDWGMGMHSTIPGSRSSIELRTTSVDTAGSVHRVGSIKSFELVPEAETEPEILQGLRATTTGVVKATFEDIVSSRGETLWRVLHLDGLSPVEQLRAQEVIVGGVELGIPLPLEAVGVGAKWRVKHVQGESSSARCEQSVSLTKLRGSKVTLDLEVQSDSGEQALPGGKGSTKMRSSSHATAQLELDPFKRHFTAHSEMSERTEMEGQLLQMRSIHDDEVETRRR